MGNRPNKYVLEQQQTDFNLLLQIIHDYAMINMGT